MSNSVTKISEVVREIKLYSDFKEVFVEKDLRELETRLNKRIEKAESDINKRIDKLEKDMKWFVTIGLGVTAIVIKLLSFV